MNLGKLDICLRVHDAGTSQDFYEDLGFVLVEGKADDGWVVVERQGVRLGLFEPNFMDEDIVSLNFREGNVAEVVETMENAGRDPSKGPKYGTRGAMVQYRDPDGYLVFFESTKA